MAQRLLIVDDQATVRQGLRSLLSSTEWQVCGEAIDGLEAIQKAKSLKPNLIIMDISMPRMGGIEATQIIRKEVPEAKILIVSQDDPTIGADLARTAKAHGFVSKTEAAQHLLETIQRITAA